MLKWMAFWLFFMIVIKVVEPHWVHTDPDRVIPTPRTPEHQRAFDAFITTLLCIVGVVYCVIASLWA
jgi:hypothetical protein